MANRLAGNSAFSDEERAAWAGTGPPVLRERELEAPLKVKKPSKIGVQFMGDLFHKNVTPLMRGCVLDVVDSLPHHVFMVLTKRPEEAVDFLRYNNVMGRRYRFLPNLWFGISASNQPDLDRWVPALLQIPAAVRFVSMEPLLEMVDLTEGKACLRCNGEGFIDENYTCPACHSSGVDGDYLSGVSGNLNWIIAGPETGPGARLVGLDAFRSVRDQCDAAGTPFFYKPEGGLDGKIWREVPG
jgi:protein gp37